MKDRRQSSAPPPDDRERRTSQRRQSERVEVEFWVESAEGEIHYHLAANVSEGGLYLESPLPLTEGTRTRLELHLPGEETPVRCGGEVLRTVADGSGGMNVRFVDLSEEGQRRIAALIASRTD